VKKNFCYITTPIYYVNDKPHLGHAYTSIAADVISRFYKLDNYSVKFLTGTDEHGQKVEKAAKNNNMLPNDFVDLISNNFVKLSESLYLTNDDFIRTTEARHKNAVENVWQKLEAKGLIYLKKYKGYYSLRDECYYKESELIKNSNGEFVTSSGELVTEVEEENYFFKLSSFNDRLIEFYKDNTDFILPKSRYNEVVSFLEMGIEDISISRTNFSWGIKVPNDEKHVIYVWIDALTNYLTAINYPNMEQEDLDFLKNSIMIIGKDILRFHAVYFIAILMAIDLPMPAKMFAHGWWTINGEKMSKSVGNVVNPFDLVDKYGLDNVRFFLFREISFGRDGDFNESSLINKINSELNNEYGNLVNRSMSMLYSRYKKIPNIEFDCNDDLILESDKLLDTCRLHIYNLDLYNYIESIWQMVRKANSYMENMAPWKIFKENETDAILILINVLEVVKRVSILLLPVMPNVCNKILDMLNVAVKKRNFDNYLYPFPKNHEILEPKPLFTKFEKLNID
jgi:methionyl-tRNA synthetase